MGIPAPQAGCLLVTRANRTGCPGFSARLISQLGIAERGIVPTLAGLAEQFNHHMFDLGILFKGEHRHILADAALLIPAVRHLRC